MSSKELQPVPLTDAAIEAWQPGGPASNWESDRPAPATSSLRRPISALGRFKWLIVLFVLAGAGAGYVATTLVTPEYEVQARILLEQGTGTRGEGSGGPIMAAQLFEQSGYADLLTSYAVVDPVVTTLNLFVQPESPQDTTVLRPFAVSARLRPGDYRLLVEGSSWTLRAEPDLNVEKGAVGDSIGRTVGFLWQPTAEQLRGHPDVRFSVKTPREASNALIDRLKPLADDQSTFLLLRLTGENATATAQALNSWVDQFLDVATGLKRRNVGLSASILEAQRAYAAGELSSAEGALEQFRVKTITEPTERPSVMPGIEMTTSPAISQYFTAKNTAESLQRDREALERVVAEGKRTGSVSREAVLSIPSVNSDPAASQVRQRLEQQSERELKLQQLRSVFQDEKTEVQVALGEVKQYQEVLVPTALQAYLTQLALREEQIKADIVRGDRELRGMPVRTIEEQRLKRKVEVADAMYRSLDEEAARAKLAEAQTVPDITVLDTAVAPLRPTRNTAPMLLLASIGIALVLGMLTAILLDRLDRRFRHIEQATDDLGLFVLGVVPTINGKKSRQTEAQAGQVVEAFRSIRMNVRYASDPSRPLAITVTSPGPGDGKSLISSNLALSFAEAGARTLLIDGDIRRGQLASTFGIEPRPGLVEYLDGTALLAEVLRPVAAHPNLTVLPGGAKRRRAPELLATPRLTQLISQLTSEYDVVIVDSPPLGAGFDAFALASATTNMVVVLRGAVTDTKMAEAKLESVRLYPIRVIGTVLNAVKLAGGYEYYAYDGDYQVTTDDPPRLSGPSSSKRDMAKVNS